MRGFFSSCGEECACDGTDRHGGGEETELACSGVKDGDGHGGDEDGEVEAEGANQKDHEKDCFEVGTMPDVAKAFGEAASGADGFVCWVKLVEAKERERDEYGGK